MALSSLPGVQSYSWGTKLNRYLDERKTVFVPKTADQTVTSSTTFVTDSQLFYTVSAAGTYVIDATLLVVANPAGANGDIKIRWAFPTGSLYGTSMGPSVGLGTGTESTGTWICNSTSTSPSGSNAFGVSESANVLSPIRSTFQLIATATGTFGLEWAQQVSHATGTTLRTGSFLRIQRVA